MFTTPGAETLLMLGWIVAKIRRRQYPREMSYGVAPPGFRLPDGTAVGHVALQVSDLERSIDYYTRVLGFRVLTRGERDAALAPFDDDRILIRLHELPGARPVPTSGTMGLYHFAILLTDRAALGRFLSHLGSIEARVSMADHAVSEALYLSDPDGHGIEVYADRPRDTWKSDAHGELFMTTQPLDVRGVVSAGAGKPWEGMPRGTRIGHVHLHVGDLERAADFYHAALGFDKVVWSYPGALFLSAGGYHHHLGTNIWSRGPRPTPDQAQLLSWELVVPWAEDAEDAARSLKNHGHDVDRLESGWVARDPWGTTVRLVPRDHV